LALDINDNSSYHKIVKYQNIKARLKKDSEHDSK